ncbi:hypothetical protein AcV5_005916 [Taiwanofungus camphoratus]|nr:hypothetical protein AcV5_005916 [Antrodia cinnamomea]
MITLASNRSRDHWGSIAEVLKKDEKIARAACGLGGRKEDECGLSKAPQTARHDGTQEHVTYETRCSRDGIARDATADCLMRNDNVSRN